MRKLRLHLDELHVETFEATPSPEQERGTVHGNLTPQRFTVGYCESVTDQYEGCGCFITEIGDTCDVCYNTEKCVE